jgi:gas vesicle protein
MSNSSTKIILGFLAGAAVGAALGILFAPDKGTETRKNLRNKIKDLEDQIKDDLAALEEEDIKNEN